MASDKGSAPDDTGKTDQGKTDQGKAEEPGWNFDAIPEALRDATRRAADLAQNPYARSLLAAGLVAAAAALAANKNTREATKRNIKHATDAAEVAAHQAGEVGLAIVNAATEAVQHLMGMAGLGGGTGGADKPTTADTTKSSAKKAPPKPKPAAKPAARRSAAKSADAPAKPAPKPRAKKAESKPAPPKPAAARSRTKKTD